MESSLSGPSSKESGSTAPNPPSRKKPQKLATIVFGEPSEEQRWQRPERRMVDGNSHVAQRFCSLRPWYLRKAVKRDAAPKVEEPDADQRLYVMLCREKIAEQQAAMAAREEKANASAPRKKLSCQTSSAEESNPTSPSPKAAPRQLFGEPKGTGVARHVSEVKKATDEFLEFKEIGRLYDLWKEQQRELGLQLTPPPSARARAREPPPPPSEKPPPPRKHRKARIDSAPPPKETKSPRAERLRRSVPSPACGDEAGGARAESRPCSRGSSAVASVSKDPKAAARASSEAAQRAEERRIAGRLYQIVTDREFAPTKALGLDRVAKGPLPRQMDGFPALSLMKLYQGPWKSLDNACPPIHHSDHL